MFASSFRSSARLATSARAFSTTQRAAFARMSIVGRLGVQPEEITVSNDRTIVRYVVGTNYGKGENQKTSWFRCASFVDGKQKDFLLNTPKGSLVHIDADARMETFTDNEGIKRQNLSLITRSFDVITRPRTDYGSVETNDEGIVQDALSQG
ncbi:ssDNA binding protein-like protein [Sporormia fimetaria CBS 119925]|uniref:SsDNA binding protein-like protein n=1 Tax=Sporormia fimetaria CBS 119925 TaxID=1340428 RepID=A0A6A6VAW1_9PLEO|nr:ssDNA binding protein-like protein [Sporormia fimetaria CBS 119925]